MYGFKTVAVTKEQAEEMEVAKMKMLRFAMRVMRRNKITNGYIGGTVKVQRLEMKMKEGKQRWYGHVIRRDQEYVGRRVMKMEILGKRKAEKKISRRSEGGYGEVGAREKDIGNSMLWRSIIRFGNP